MADDKESNRQLLVEFLSNPGIDVIDAENGKIAVEMAKLYRPNLVLMDLKMPVMDGFEVCRQLKKNPAAADIPIIFLTGKDMGAGNLFLIKCFACQANFFKV